MNSLTNMEIEALVIERQPNLLYMVETQDGKQYMCYLAGKMRLHKISVMVGDRVRVLLDPAGGKATNRIIRRM